MNLNTYEIFLAVSANQSFQKAASQLNLTPSAISHAISSLEKEIGFSLFVRNRQHITLTSQGETLLPYIQSVCNADAALSQEISLLNNLDSGQIKIGCISSVCIHWIPEIVKEFRRLFPGIELTIVQGTYHDIAKWVSHGQVDIGFLSASSAMDLDFIPLYKDPFICLFPDFYQPVHKDYITIEEMKTQPFINLRETIDADVKTFLNQYNLTDTGGCYVEDDRSAAALVASGMGLCMLPYLAALPLSANVKILPIESHPYRTLGLSIHKASSKAPAVKKMIDFIIDYSQKQNSSIPVL